MKINISDLLQQKVESIAFDFYADREDLDREGFKIGLKNKARITGVAYYDGEIVSVTGRIAGVMGATCSRCLKVYDHSIDVGFDEKFSKDEQEDEEIYPVNNNEIDLKDLVIDQIILSMPLKMLCNENCKGLCPKCGCNLNDESCSCDRNIVDPRFAVLKDLFKDD
jgi:uncharacterized protein